MSRELTPGFLQSMVEHSIRQGMSIGWCAEFGIEVVAVMMVRDLGGLYEFKEGLRRAALTEIERLDRLRADAPSLGFPTGRT